MADKKRAQKVDRRETREIKDEGKENFERYVNKYGDKRMFLRLVLKKKVKPCDRECREYGYWIVKDFNNHSSFENFEILPNDEEFLIEAARISHNPAECPIFFYDYVNPYLKAKSDFRLKFLKSIYLNDNVTKLEDFNTIVDYCKFEKEQTKLLADLDFRRQFEKRIADLTLQLPEYHCSGDEKELKKFKIKFNEEKIRIENQTRDLNEVLETFTVGKEEEVVKEEPSTYYEFLLQQSRM